MCRAGQPRETDVDGGEDQWGLEYPWAAGGINRANETTMVETLARNIASQSGLVNLQVSYLVVRYTRFYLLPNAA